MKNILIVADGITAKYFLQRLQATNSQKSKYYIVYYDDFILPSEKTDKFLYYKFDPTSLSKLSTILKSVDFYQAMLILSNKQDVLATSENISIISPKLNVIVLDRWGLDINEQNVTSLDVDELLVNRFINYIPNIPVYAKEVGLGIGDVIDMTIPFTSSYAYKHIGSITQNRWQIAAIYRKKRLILPTDSLMLLPNDSVLAVGSPSVLQGVYRSINREFGQFPQPFGENIYTIIDMLKYSESEIEVLINEAMLLHAKLNNKNLIFRVINPSLTKCFDKLKSYSSDTMMVKIDYVNRSFSTALIDDIKNYEIGLVLTNDKTFKEYIELFYEIKLPIFKIAYSGFSNIIESVILSNNSTKVETISSSLFDISSQLELDIAWFEFKHDEDENEKVLEHFESLSKLFERKINIKKSKKNPIVELKGSNSYLQFILFEEEIIQMSFFQKIFSTRFDDHFSKLSSNYQIFIPAL